MAARTLQPSEYEIQREVEALRDIRRRSAAPGALTIDPDLPNQTSPSSPTGRVWPSGSATSPRRSASNSSASSYDRNSSDRSSHDAPSAESENVDTPPSGETDDPFHLFWVPASVHPEIAPAEFRAFLKEHARAIPPDGAELGRSVSSASTSSLGRKRSMLRRQYQPHENDGVEEEETVVPLRRNRSYLYNPVPLSFDDLQRLEQLAEEASENDDSSKLRTMLRRSLSLNLSPSAIDRMDSVPEMGDEADVPIIVPPPGQILRRAARTKIRKPSLPGDGAGHRFSSTRRGARAATLPPTAEQRNSSDFSSSEHGDTSVEADNAQQRRQTFSDDGFPSQRPDSYTEEASSIFDAYVRDEDDTFISPSLVVTSSPPPSADSTDLKPSHEIPQIPILEVPPALLDALDPVLHQPQPQRLLSPQPSLESQQSSRTPSPSVEGSIQESLPEAETPSPSSSPAQHQTTPAIQESQEPPSQSQYPPQIYQPQPPAPSKPLRKDKKGLFGKWGSDKSSKKSKEPKDKEKERPEREKEKETGFFGSLFGQKKKQDTDSAPSMVGGNVGREAAQALLGTSKSSKNYVPPSSPGLAPGANPYARYPIHVERAIYRLSHIKLANPRRPLYEQVLISNLMFWYLGVINKTPNPTPVVQAQPNGTPGLGAENPGEGNQQNAEEAEEEQREREQREQEQRERERAEKERLEREREMEMKKKESGKRGSLTKQPAGGSGGRRAEMPVRGPQYEMQHRVMEQEYGNYNMQSNQQVGWASANGQPHPRQQPQQYSSSSPKSGSPQPMQPEHPYHNSQQQAQRLPPGAMPPVDQTQTWISQNNHQRARNPSPQRSRTPPQNPMNPPPVHRQAPSLPQDGFAGAGLGGGRGPSRSLSANAVPVPQANGAAKLRKGSSAHAISPSPQPQARRPRSSEGPKVDFDGMGEEEDMPLAALKQQRRVV